MYLRKIVVACALLAATSLPALAAPAVKGDVKHEAIVDISEQTMKLYLNGKLDAVWPVSTARKGKVTPRGSWSPDFLSRNHKSSRYNNAPMPFSVFYSGNFAIHGTDQVSKLGTPASAGCIRLATENAEIIFNRVETDGKKSFRVTVVD